MPPPHGIEEIKGSVWSASHEVLGGVPVFSGTRVPIATYLDHVRKGIPVEVFADDFPTVRTQQIQILDDCIERYHSIEVEQSGASISAPSDPDPSTDMSEMSKKRIRRLSLNSFLDDLYETAGYSAANSESWVLSALKR